MTTARVFPRPGVAKRAHEVEILRAETRREAHEGAEIQRAEAALAQVVTVFWRDIPAQVIVGKGRRAAKRALPERFEQAIDRCAMKVGAKDDDAYLAEWRKAGPVEVAGDDASVADAEAARLDAEYDQDRIKTLIANDGWAEAR